MDGDGLVRDRQGRRDVGGAECKERVGLYGKCSCR